MCVVGGLIAGGFPDLNAVSYTHLDVYKRQTLLEMINASEAREDDETFKNPVDVMFDELEARDPDHFAVKQYRKYKLAAGDICSK